MLVSECGAHINGIENFWSHANWHLRRYNGIPTAHFELFLKEYEWRFNYGTPHKLQKTLLNWHLIWASPFHNLTLTNCLFGRALQSLA